MKGSPQRVSKFTPRETARLWLISAWGGSWKQPRHGTDAPGAFSLPGDLTGPAELSSHLSLSQDRSRSEH